MIRSLTLEAPAKVNLVLRILGPRADGFHDIETLFQSVALADRVRVSVGDGGPPPAGEDRRAAPPIALRVEGPDLGPAEENLAYRAARAFVDEFGAPGPIRVELLKRIPTGAGLGGGSSDAAAVLRALAVLAEVDDGVGLESIAAALGSDVPFFLGDSPLAIGRGRGEVLTGLAPLPERAVVLALPDVHVASGEAYRALAERRAAARDAGAHDPPAGGLDEAAAGSWSTVVERAHNDFEALIADRYDEVRASLAGLRDEGADVALLSGSGAASFGVFDDHAAAAEAARRLTERLGWPFVVTATRTVVPEPEADGD